jgi:phage terminase Nu1 subunit (DNA packaging protein)
MAKKLQKQLSCTAAHLAEMFGLSVPRVSQMIAEGIVVKVEIGKYDCIASVQNYLDKLRRKKPDKIQDPDTSGVPNIDTSKARKEAALAEKEELRLAEMKLEVVPISEVEQREARIGAAVRAAITKQRSELPPILEGLTANQIASIIDERNRALLDELADMQSEFWERREKLIAATTNE